MEKISSPPKWISCRGKNSACELESADSQSVVEASRLLGCPLPVRVTGIDPMTGVLRLSLDIVFGV